MNVRIEEIKDDFPYDLLLIADEAIEAIDKYLYDSDVYVVKNGELKIGVFCLYRIDENAIEIKNIAVLPQIQNKGIGSSLLKEIEKIALRKRYKTILVGTADCGVNQIRFYEKNGYSRYAVRKNFFLENYSQPIYEEGIMLKDMILLKKEIEDVSFGGM